jgi:hypothetical protein
MILALLAAQGIETVQRLDHYFGRLGDRRILDTAAILAAGFALAYAIRLVREGAGRHSAGATTALLLVGFLFQHSLALTEKKGLDGMRDHLLRSGHNEFARTVTTRRIEPIALVAGYERLVQDPDQGFARSKPPGTLLVYWMADRAAQALMPWIWDPPMPADSPYVANLYHWRLANFATLFFPLFSYAVLWPLGWLGRRFLGPADGLWPAFLYVLVPATALVPLHLDAVLYPFLACSLWALAAAVGEACERAAVLLGVAAGAVAWLCLFVSFSLLPALPLALAFAAAARAREGRQPWYPLRALGAGVAAFLVLGWTVWMLGGYDPFERYRQAMTNHMHWKGWQESFRVPAAITDAAEFLYWLGMPIVLLFAHQTVAALKRMKRPQSPSWSARLALGLCFVLAATALLGRTLSEVNRLWLFFVPAMVIVAAQALRRIAGPRTEPALTAVVALQVGWAVVLKCYEGFPPGP